VAAETRDDLQRTGPLLLAVLVACTAAAAGMTTLLQEPEFEFVLHLMIFVAVFSSAFLGRWSTFIGVAVIAVGVAALTQRIAPVPGIELLYPPEVVADDDLTWATLWSWLMVGFCFMLGSRRNVLFPLVAGLAIFGLMGTVNLNAIMLVTFAIFIFAVVFIWGYEHLLNLGEDLPEAGTKAAEWLGMARTQAIAGSLLVAVLLAVGMLIGSGLYLVGPRLFVGPGGMTRYAQYLQRNLLTYGGVIDSFSVGGGPIHLSSAPAIRVSADRPALWRGAAYDYYTGTGWRRQLEERIPLRRDEEGWWVVPGTEDLIGQENRQVVTLDNMSGRALYAAARPVRVRMTEESFERTRARHAPSVDMYQTLRTEFMMSEGTEFEVVSIMPTTDPETLRATSTEYSRRIVEYYLEQMQVQAQVELSALVEEIVADAETPYDKVQAIRDFLSVTCVYTTRAPAVPYGEDAAVYFVQQGQRGACGLFATSMAVMARLAGVPARVATGYQTGVYDPEAGQYVPLQRDAHAWAEIYFAGVGWVPWDISAEELDDDDLLAFLRAGQWRRELSAFLSWLGNVVMIALVIAALVSAVLGPGVLLRWVRGRARTRTARERMGLAFERFRRRASRLARIRLERWRTPAEMQLALIDRGLGHSPQVRERLDEFTRRFYDHRYGRAEPSEEEIARVKAQARALLNDLREEKRRHRGESDS
jgi:transglutaminase-like putative cysteine protease